MIKENFIKINNLILDKMINNKFYYFIKNKNNNHKFNLYLKENKWIWKKSYKSILVFHPFKYKKCLLL